MRYEGAFLSEADGLSISTAAMIPDQKPYRAVVQLVHGMSEHKERYFPFMEYLAGLGYLVVIHDHLWDIVWVLLQSVPLRQNTIAVWIC